MPNIARAGDQRPDIVVQVTGQVQDEVADAVAERERLGPELFLADDVRGLVDAIGQVAEITGELIGGGLGQFGGRRRTVWVMVGSPSCAVRLH